MLAGADGYKKRWIVAFSDGGASRLEMVGSFEELSSTSALELLVIDVPIGLPDVGARTCDRLARAMIGPRRSSVFPAPIRPMLGARTYEEACERRASVEGKRCSKQLFAILPLIESVDRRMSPELQRRIREGHPEVSFTALAGRPMREHKARPDGQAQRRELLRAEFPDLDENIARFRRPDAITDILDAYALLWSARRHASSAGASLPLVPEYDGTGLRIEMAY